MTLAEFITARLDEDERYLRTMIDVGERLRDEATPQDMADGYSIAMKILDDPQARRVFEELTDGKFTVPNDLHRLLREVAAKRAILAAHPQVWPHPDGPRRCSRCWNAGADGVPRMKEWPCPTVRALAAVWSDHESYDQRWRP